GARLDAQQDAVAEPGSFARPRLARDGDMNLGRRTVRRLVPFVRRGDQLAVGVAPAWCSFLRRFSISPSSARSRRARLSSARAAFFRPKARAISRVPTLPG